MKKDAGKFGFYKKMLYLCTRKTGKPVLYEYRGVEQLVARQAHNLEVARSNPASATREARFIRASFVFYGRRELHPGLTPR